MTVRSHRQSGFRFGIVGIAAMSSAGATKSGLRVRYTSYTSYTSYANYTSYTRYVLARKKIIFICFLSSHAIVTTLVGHSIRPPYPDTVSGHVIRISVWYSWYCWYSWYS